MGNTKERLISTCYIGETRAKAGIFLSERIAHRRPYHEHLKLESFKSFSDAEKEFFSRYPFLKEMDDFTLNTLYQVRNNPTYTVLSSLDTVMVSSLVDAGNYVEDLIPNYRGDIWVKEGMEYEDAQEYAKMRFCRIYKNPTLYINFRLPINVPIHLADIVKYKQRGTNIGFKVKVRTLDEGRTEDGK